MYYCICILVTFCVFYPFFGVKKDVFQKRWTWTRLNSVNSVTDQTSFFQEVEWAQKATGSGDFRLTIPRELGKLIARQVHESGDIAEDQIGEGLWVLVSQSLHKEVRVKYHWLACVWLFVAGKHTAFRLPVRDTNGFNYFEGVQIGRSQIKKIWPIILNRKGVKCQ